MEVNISLCTDITDYVFIIVPWPILRTDTIILKYEL